jgi:hypothetical protein
MVRTRSHFAHFQAIAASLLVHAGLVGLLVYSANWKGFWLPVEETKAGDKSPLEGFTVVLAPSNAVQYMPQSESLAAEQAERAAQTTEADTSSLNPELSLDATTAPESGIGTELQHLELPENARSAKIDAIERQSTGSPDSRKADGDESDLLNRYYAAFRNNLALRWQGPTLAMKAECRLLVSQLEKGQLVDVVFLDCPVSADVRQQIVQALDKSVALPYQGYEQVIRNPMEVTVCFPEMVSC